MKYFYIVLVMLLTGPSLGCALSTTAPNDDAGFASTENIQALEGCYRNRGEGQGQQYLSAVIWPKEKLAHEQIKAIHVVFEQPRKLRVAAIGSGVIIKEEIFVEGKDFHMVSGRIKIKSDTVASFAYPAGNVFIGVGHESQDLGLDEHGNARLQQSTAFAGTAFLVIPVAGNVRDAFRFPKVLDLCNNR